MLGSPILYLKCMRTAMFLLSGFYYRAVQDLGFGVWDLGFKFLDWGISPSSFSLQRVPPRRSPEGSRGGGQGLEFRVQGFGFRVQGLGFRVQGLGFRVLGLGFWVQGFGFWVQGSGHHATREQEAYRDLPRPRVVLPPGGTCRSEAPTTAQVAKRQTRTARLSRPTMRRLSPPSESLASTAYGCCSYLYYL